HSPRVDELFLSCAASGRREVAGVLLTGMGADGVEGLLALRKAGGITLVQDEASCVVVGMPRVALAGCAGARAPAPSPCRGGPGRGARPTALCRRAPCPRPSSACGRRAASREPAG